MNQRKVFFIIISISIGLVAGIWLWASLVLSQKEDTIGIRILRASDGTLMSRTGLSWWYQIPYHWNLENKLIKSIIQIEDQRFYRHHGVDIWGKIWAIRENIRAGGIVRWGSTITEQYIKNTYYRSEKRTYLQKIKESILASVIEIWWDKEQILRGYLDTIYMWNSFYGIGTALSEYYGNTWAENLDDQKIAELLERIHSPNTKDLIYEKKLQERLWLQTGEQQSTYTEYKKWAYFIDRFPLLKNRVQKEREKYCVWKENQLAQFLQEDPPAWICKSESWDLRLSVDSRAMQYAQDELESTIQPLEKENIHNGAIYIIHPLTQKVIVYIGNREQNNAYSDIDMITERRSIGSILKPFIYLFALKNGADTEDFVLDNHKPYPTGKENTYFVPENYIPKSYGPVRIREALWNSLNSSTVRITESLWLSQVYDFLKEIGADFNHDVGYYGYGLSLGTPELTLENIVQIYRYITLTKDRDSYLITRTLSDGGNRAKTFWLSSILETSIPLPVKTGTSTDFRDNWTVSYHGDAIIGIWVGNSDNSSMEDVSWVSGAWPLWKKMAEYLIRRWLIREYQIDIPEGIHTIPICLDRTCIQKEIHPTKKTTTPKSRIRDKLYFEEDFFGQMTQEEKKEWKIQ